MVAFTGAHYFSISAGSSGWTVFDDAKLTPLERWIDVIYYLLGCQGFPKILFFEKRGQNAMSQTLDISPDDLLQMQKHVTQRFGHDDDEDMLA